MLYLAGIIITAFLVFILISKKNKSTADKILALWLFFTGFHLSLFYLHFNDHYIKFPFLLGLELPLPLIQGPFLYLYTTALTSPNQKRKYAFLHFIPFLIAFLVLIPFFSLPFEKRISIFKNGGKGYEDLITILYASILLSGIVYAFLSLNKLSKHRKNITDQFSFTEKINLTWLRYLIFGLVIIWLVVIFSDDRYIFSVVVFYLFFIGYFGIKQVGIFTNQPLPVNNPPEKISIESEPTENQLEKVKYEKSGLGADELQSIHQKLTAMMQKEKQFKNPDLTLTELSQTLNVHPNILSQVINSVEQKNFYDYINCHRVEEFKNLIQLPENQKYTLLSLAFECGFNSKTAFNRNFKKATGVSPSEYLK
ncbi:helix-turn-helix domain-containing protein [Flavobacterium poyangense]|uniref:helix-turn-helix domain-containing protein n=1 Tax=Flavobacterium poyangense TaxID=2204302 RepID=UPI00141D8F83|nr:helix-turn-helix domain-containing protein [Flavobacterium sp. JXAS1]